MSNIAHNLDPEDTYLRQVRQCSSALYVFLFMLHISRYTYVQVHFVFDLSADSKTPGFLGPVAESDSLRLVHPLYSVRSTHSIFISSGSSRHIILRSFASLRHLPVNILLRRLDIARLAMNAASPGGQSFPSCERRHLEDLLLGIDLESHTMGFRIVLHILIHARGAETVL